MKSGKSLIKHRAHLKHYLIGVLVAVMGGVTYVIAAVTFADFVPGSTISSSEMNAKLNALKDAVNATQAQLAVSDYRPVGPQINVPAFQVSTGGWTVCHTSLYNTVLPPIATVLASCPQANLMLACRPVGTNTYSVLAQAPSADVAFATPNDATTVHVANGTGWYALDAESWGFAKAGDAVNKSVCDILTPDNEQRLCWHGNTQAAGGYRCGVTTALNSSTAWERVVLQRN